MTVQMYVHKSSSACLTLLSAFVPFPSSVKTTTGRPKASHLLAALYDPSVKVHQSLAHGELIAQGQAKNTALLNLQEPDFNQ